jgi:hypothetical protein
MSKDSNRLETEGQTDSRRRTEKHRQTDTDRQTFKQITNRKTDTDRPTGIQTDYRQKYRHTYTQTDYK